MRVSRGTNSKQLTSCADIEDVVTSRASSSQVRVQGSLFSVTLDYVLCQTETHRLPPDISTVSTALQAPFL